MRSGEMKKLFFILLWMITHVVYADSYEVVIFNMSEKYDLSVRYRLCMEGHQGNEFCGDQQSISVNAKNTNNKNYVIIKEPDPSSDIDAVLLEVLSAVEKDGDGKIFAQEKYCDVNSWCRTNCLGYLYASDFRKGNIVNTQLILNDMHESPFITCTTTGFLASSDSPA